MAGILSLVTIVLVSCTKPPPPNVLIVTFDTARYDHFGTNGDSDARTPNVDALAERGVSFEHAYSSVPLTLPAHATMMTGREPFEHGVRNNGHFRVPDAIPTLAEILKADGYRTAGFVSASVLASQHQLSRGFDHYDDQTNTRGGTLNLTIPKRRGDETTDAAIGWLESRREDSRPFFLWVHYFDPHRPYELIPPYDEMANRYAASISFADAQFGRLLEKVESVQGERGSFVIFTSDHGEGLGEHGESTHGLVAYDSTLRVPLIVSGPGVPRGERRSDLAGHSDLMPSVLAAVGLPAPAGLSGRNLLAGRPKEAEDSIVRYFESEGAHYEFGWQPIAGVRTGRWKYTAIPAPVELYDVQSDPGELHNLADSEADARSRMEDLWARFERLRSAPSPGAKLEEVTLETLEQLAALGYVQAPQAFAPGEAPDPRQFIATLDWMEEAREKARVGNYDVAIDRLEALTQSASIRVLALRTLAPIYAEAGRIEDSIRTFRAYIALADTEESRVGLARVLLAADRTAEALELLEGLEHADASTVVTMRAVALAGLGRQEEARALVDDKLTGAERYRVRGAVVLEGAPVPDGEGELRTLLEKAPEDASLKSWLGYYLAVWGRPEQADEALALLRSASKAHPNDAELRANLGWAAYRLGRDDEAIAQLVVALQIEGTRHRDRFRLVFPLLRQGERSLALRVLRQAVAARPGAPWAKKTAPKLTAMLDAGSIDAASLREFELVGD